MDATWTSGHSGSRRMDLERQERRDAEGAYECSVFVHEKTEERYRNEENEFALFSKTAVVTTTIVTRLDTRATQKNWIQLDSTLWNQLIAFSNCAKRRWRRLLLLDREPLDSVQSVEKSNNLLIVDSLLTLIGGY